MGSPPRLKAKRDHQYRKAARKDHREYRCCWHCTQLIFMAFSHGKDYRCRVLGLRESIRYRVGINNLCNRFERRTGWPAPEGVES